MFPILADMAFKFDTDAFMKSLPTMGLGMLGIFIVTGVIVLTIGALNFFTKPRKKDN